MKIQFLSEPIVMIKMIAITDTANIFVCRRPDGKIGEKQYYVLSSTGYVIDCKTGDYFNYDSVCSSQELFFDTEDEAINAFKKYANV